MESIEFVLVSLLGCIKYTEKIRGLDGRMYVFLIEFEMYFVKYFIYYDRLK